MANIDFLAEVLVSPGIEFVCAFARCVISVD